MKKGLVMEGGAMRGMFTAGVTDVLLENGIEFDGGIGVSAGATFGSNYKSKQIGRVIRYNKKAVLDYRYGSIKSLLIYGNIFEIDYCFHQLPFVIDPYDKDTFLNNPMEFWIGCSDAVTGKPFYKKIDTLDPDDVEWVRASATIPMISDPVEIDGHYYLDGGMTDSIPLEFFESIGYDRNVVILTRPRDYRKKPSKIIPFARIFLRKYPNFIKALKNRHIMYNREKEMIHERGDKGEIFVICPEESLGIPNIERDPNELQRIYELGREVATKRLDDLKKFLSEEK